MTLSKLNFRPEKSDYRYNINRDVVSIELEGGLSRRRRDIVGSASIINCTWFLLDHEYQYFMAFYQFYLKRGSTPFLIDLLLEQPFLEEVTASFVEQTLEMKQIGTSYEVSCDLEVVPPSNDDFAELVLLLYDENSDGQYFLSLEQLANYDLDFS